MPSSGITAAHSTPAPKSAITAKPISFEAINPSPHGVSLYRLKQVLARIPVSRSAWFAGMQAGRYPRSYSLGPRTTVWRSDDIDRIVASITPSQPLSGDEGILPC